MIIYYDLNFKMSLYQCASIYTNYGAVWFINKAIVALQEFHLEMCVTFVILFYSLL